MVAKLNFHQVLLQFSVFSVSSTDPKLLNKCILLRKISILNKCCSCYRLFIKESWKIEIKITAGSKNIKQQILNIDIAHHIALSSRVTQLHYLIVEIILIGLIDKANHKLRSVRTTIIKDDWQLAYYLYWRYGSVLGKNSLRIHAV